MGRSQARGSEAVPARRDGSSSVAGDLSETRRRGNDACAPLHPQRRSLLLRVALRRNVLLRRGSQLGGGCLMKATLPVNKILKLVDTFGYMQVCSAVSQKFNLMFSVS